MSFISNNLLQDEHIVAEGQVHWMIFSSCLIWLGFAAAANYAWAIAAGFSHYSTNTLFEFFFLAIALVDLSFSSLRFLCTEYAVTNKRVLGKTGFISRNSVELFLQKVEGIHVKQSILGRLFGYGDLFILGTGGTQDKFGFIANPLAFRRQVQQQMASIKLVG